MKRNSFLAVLIAIATTVTLVRPASAQCEPEWMPGSGIPGTEWPPMRMLAWDPDGPGPRSETLIVASSSPGVAGTERAKFAAMFDGTRWFSMDEGLFGPLSTLAVFDDGDGPSVFAVGHCDDPKGTWACLLKWNESKWSRVPGEVTAAPDGLAGFDVLEVFDDGSGPALFAAGGFASVDGVPARNIAKWNGKTWSAAGEGIIGSVSDMQAFDDGSGPALYIARTCPWDDYGLHNCLTRWDGHDWIDVPDVYFGQLVRMAVLDVGSGPKLVVTGGRYSVETGEAYGIATWDGRTWASISSEYTGTPSHIAVFDDGTGAALYILGTRLGQVNGQRGSGLARWDGTSWYLFDSGTTSRGYALTVYNPGTGPRLIASGRMHFDGWAGNLSAWDGHSWSRLSDRGTQGVIYAFANLDRGNGPELCAAGTYSLLEGTSTNNVACWNGEVWSGLGSGIVNPDRSYAVVEALAVFNDAIDPTLYACGDLYNPYTEPGYSVVRWNGTEWSPAGNGLPGHCHALHVFDDGSGPRLFASGSFIDPDGNFRSGVAVWDGAVWSIVGFGIAGTIYAFEEFDDGHSLGLFAAGDFSSVGGASTPHIARWNGSAWQPFGSLYGWDAIFALRTFDDGSGPALYAAGSFSTIDGVAAASIAKWNGIAWSAVGGGLPYQPYGPYDQHVSALTVHDDGRGPALFATGTFSTAGGVLAHGIARWDGAAWTTLGEGLSYEGYALHSFDDGGGPTLFVGGNFLTAGPHVSASLARWKCKCQHCDTDSDGDVDRVDFRSFAACLTGPQTPPPPPCAPHRLDSGQDIDLADFALLQNEFAP